MHWLAARRRWNWRIVLDRMMRPPVVLCLTPVLIAAALCVLSLRIAGNIGPRRPLPAHPRKTGSFGDGIGCTSEHAIRFGERARHGWRSQLKGGMRRTRKLDRPRTIVTARLIHSSELKQVRPDPSQSCGSSGHRPPASNDAPRKNNSALSDNASNGQDRRHKRVSRERLLGRLNVCATPVALFALLEETEEHAFIRDRRLMASLLEKLVTLRARTDDVLRILHQAGMTWVWSDAKHRRIIDLQSAPGDRFIWHHQVALSAQFAAHEAGWNISGLLRVVTMIATVHFDRDGVLVSAKVQAPRTC